jgi:hypothetical protein
MQQKIENNRRSSDEHNSAQNYVQNAYDYYFKLFG